MTGPVVQVTIDVAAGPTAQFRPSEMFGAGIDGAGKREVARLFTATNLAKMESAGLGPVSYRLRTELAIEAWHWNEEGAWSDPAREQGYWTSSDRPRHPVLISYGYRLPRRGDTIDQANNKGYSRLDDGDLASFWKSNPYLEAGFTGEGRSRPQWVVVEFPRPEAIDAAVIRWAVPFAKRYQVQYWTGADAYDDAGRWRTFAGGAVNDGQGGAAQLKLAAQPVKTRFVRVLLEVSSNTAPHGSSDPRDAAGFAIAEISLGAFMQGGRFVDSVRHAPSRGQTIMHVSSTDPWHRAVDRDPDLEQPGFDRVFNSGITRGLPVMVPVGALYDTPQNAAAEVSFLKARGYLVRRVEIGEEPDGQDVSPEDYGALYLEFARAVHAADPTVTVGGPSLQAAVSDTWLDANPDHSWTRRLMHYLSGRGALGSLGFFSFERYPFDDLCGDLGRKLVRETAMLSADLSRLRADDVPAAIPWIITEYGLSAFGGRGEVEMPGALVDADIAAQFASTGGAGAYLFGYGPARPYQGGRTCAGYGNLMLFEADAQGGALAPMPTFYESRMLTQDWAGGDDQIDAVFTAHIGARGGSGSTLTAYALRRNDGRWSLLLINRDRKAVHSVRIVLRTAARPAQMAGPLHIVQYGQAQYLWAPKGEQGRPGRDLPPLRFQLDRPGGAIDLPPWSLTVVTSANPAGAKDSQ